MRPFLFLLAVIIAYTAAPSCRADEVKQLTFGGYNRTTKTCELNELGFAHDREAKTYPGRIGGNGGPTTRYFLCDVSIPRKTFDERYRFCALASVESPRASGYVCEVFHFKESVLFSYSHDGAPSELPMCSFVCPSR